MIKKSKVVKAMNYYIVIIKLDSSLPICDSKKAHLYIGMSLSEAETRLCQLKKRGGPLYARGRYLSIFSLEPYAKPAKDLKVAKKRLDETIERYSRLGHTVNNSSDVWHVYVIDLKQDHLKTQPKQGHVYVGSTSKSIAQRINEHKEGSLSKKGHGLNSKYVTKYFDQLNTSLTLKQKFFSRAAAEGREESYAEKLCKRGFLVRAGQFTPNPKTCISKQRSKNKK